MAGPRLIKEIPAQIMNELASFGPFDLKQFIELPSGGGSGRFSGELSTGDALPKGLILTSDGILTGIAAKDTQGQYDIVVTAENDVGNLKAHLSFTIQPGLAQEQGGGEGPDKMKAMIWEALQNQQPLPDLNVLMSLPITALDIYYLLERWGTLTIWDAFNLDSPSAKKLLKLEGLNEHYQIYDRGSSLIMAPTDLFSIERTTFHGVQAARILAKEVYKRNWTIEMAGFDKWMHTAWVEFQMLGDKNGKYLEIVNYTPTPEELRAYQVEAAAAPGLSKGNE